MKKWFLVLRPWSFPASIIPILVALSFICYKNELCFCNVNLIIIFLTILAGVIFQAAANLISDYYDYIHKIDTEETAGAKMLVEKQFQPKEVLIYGIVLLLIGCSIGVYILFMSSIQLLWIGLIGAIASVFYHKLKRIALGDLCIFIIFGILLAQGTSVVLTNKLNFELSIISTALGCMIVNILHANNIRDREHDIKANIKTQAIILGINNSILKYKIFAYLPYLIITASIIFKIISPISLIVFLALPHQIYNVKQLEQINTQGNIVIYNLDAKSSKQTFFFGILLVIANLLSTFI